MVMTSKQGGIGMSKDFRPVNGGDYMTNDDINKEIAHMERQNKNYNKHSSQCSYTSKIMFFGGLAAATCGLMSEVPDINSLPDNQNPAVVEQVQNEQTKKFILIGAGTGLSLLSFAYAWASNNSKNSSQKNDKRKKLYEAVLRHRYQTENQ